MRLVLVNKKNNYAQLRLLFPTLRVASTNAALVGQSLAGIPVYGRYVFSDFEYPVSDSTELFLLQSPAGFTLDTQAGLCAFLSDIGYMAQSKIDRLSKLSLPDEYKIYFLYKNAISLKVANRLILKVEEDMESLVDILQPGHSLYERLAWASVNGWQETLTSILSLLDRYCDKTANGMKPGMRKVFSPIINVLDRMSLKQYQLSGDAEVDCQYLLTLFR